MGFYSPYSKSPDYGSGITEMIQNVIQGLLLKKMMGGQSDGQTPVQEPPAPMGTPMNSGPQGLTPPAPQPPGAGPMGMGAQGGGAGAVSGMMSGALNNPQIMQALMEYLAKTKGGQFNGGQGF